MGHFDKFQQQHDNKNITDTEQLAISFFGERYSDRIDCPFNKKERTEFLEKNGFEIKTLNFNEEVLMAFALEHGICVEIKRWFISKSKGDNITGQNAQKGYRQAKDADLL